MMTLDAIKQIRLEAKRLGECGLLDHTPNDTGLLISLLFCPQGVEFAAEHAFPRLELFRAIAEAGDERLKVDTGTTTINNAYSVLVGATAGICTYDDPKRVHKLVLAHGAGATIRLGAYCVLSVEAIGKGCSMDIDAHPTATIIRGKGL